MHISFGMKMDRCGNCFTAQYAADAAFCSFNERREAGA